MCAEYNPSSFAKRDARDSGKAVLSQRFSLVQDILFQKYLLLPFS